MKKKNNAWLRAQFQVLNHKFFDGLIKEPQEIRFVDVGSGRDGVTMLPLPDADVKTSIRIHKDYAKHPNVACGCLLHEMIHVRLGAGYRKSHGIRFGAELVRLFEAGAYDDLL